MSFGSSLPKIKEEPETQVTNRRPTSRGSESSKISTDLENFRQQWIQELQTNVRMTVATGSSSCQNSGDQVCANAEKDRKMLARSLYQIGIAEERAGNPFKAVNYYAKACRIFPDIEQEFRMGQTDSPRSSDVTTPACESENEDFDDDPNNNATSSRGNWLNPKSNNQSASVKLDDNCNWLCEPEVPLAPDKLHISMMPYDVMMKIFCHVALPDFDFRSLEQCALVCRGFHALARAPELWKQACNRVWGDYIPVEYDGLTWREMFLKRPRLNFHGVYISKVVYTRQGEHSFDNTYDIFLTVEYFRYLRFLPGGTVLMYTSPEEPKLVVSKLRYLNCRLSGIKSGNYTLQGDKVILCLKDTNEVLKSANTKSKRTGSAVIPYYFYQTSFFITFSIASLGRKKPSCKLNWVHYSVQNNKVTPNPTLSMMTSSNICSPREQDQQSQQISTGPITEFNINSPQFKPFIFSRVKSYTSCAP